MGVGISCKNGLNLHFSEMLTNYATNKFESRRQRKNNNLNKSKSDSSLFTVVSTKSNEQSNSDQYDPRKRRRDKKLDEHEASQVIFYNLPNNENLFIEKLNCDFCIQQYLGEDGVKELEQEQMLIETKLETIINQSTANNENEPNDGLNENHSPQNDSIKTVKSMKLTASLTELDNQDLDFIDNIDEESTNDNSLSNHGSRRLSNIEEENHDRLSKQSLKQEPEIAESRLKLNENHLERPKRSSVKVQMSNLNVPSLSSKFSIYSDQRKLKAKNKSNFKLKQNLRFNEQCIDDDESGDELVNDISLEEKQQMLEEMLKIAKREQFKLENYSFSNSFIDLDNESNTELTRSFSADCISDLLTDELQTKYSELNRAIKFNKLENKLIMYLSENDLSKLNENQLDNKSISTIKTELLNLDSIGRVLLDRDQLENIMLDNETENSRAFVGRSYGRMVDREHRSKFNLKVGLADSLLTTTKSRNRTKRESVTKTKKCEDLNKRSLVNSWLAREQNLFDESLNFNQQFNQSLNYRFNQSVDQIQNCDEDCNLCRLNEEQLNELDSDVLQLTNVLQTLDEILHEKEIQLQKLSDQAKESPSHLNICNTNKQKLVRSRANLKRKVDMLKKRGSRLGISMCKSETGKNLIVFKDGKSTYHIEIGKGR